MHKGANLPDEHHILRYIPKSKLFVDEDGEPIEPLVPVPQAFELRPNEESLSVHWVEYDGNDLTKAIQLFRLSRDKIGAKSIFAKAKVLDLKTKSSPITKAIKIVWAPSNSNPAHSVIKHIPEDPSLSTILAEEIFTELIRNSEIPVLKV